MTDGTQTSRRTAIVRLAQQRVAERLQPGDTAIDATAGNGHDTLFLARHVTERGRVIAIDLLATALQSTRQRLDEHGNRNVTLLQQSHHESFPPAASGAKAAMFNLGYLPGGDHAIRTTGATTLAGLAQAAAALAPGGVLTVVAYRGHDGGEEERAVRAWVADLPQAEFHGERIESDGNQPLSPVLFVVHRTDSAPLSRSTLPRPDNQNPAGMTDDPNATPSIELDRFLKLAQVVSSGGQAKHLIRSGAVIVNGDTEQRRGRQLRPGDVVTVDGEDYVVEQSDD